MSLIFDSENHSYTLDGRKVPSVTEIVSPITEAKYKADGGAAIMEVAKNRGTLVHRYCQLIDQGCPADALDVEPELVGYVKAYLDFLRDYNPQWELIEAAVTDGKFYAGTLDRYGTIDGRRCILDIKTTGTMDRLSRTALYYQLLLYSVCVWDYPQRLYGLQLKKDGTYKLYDTLSIYGKDINPYTSPEFSPNELISLAYIRGGYKWQKT